MSPHGFLGENRRQLTCYARDVEERSSSLWKRKKIKNKKPLKGSKKDWKELA